MIEIIRNLLICLFIDFLNIYQWKGFILVASAGTDQCR